MKRNIKHLKKLSKHYAKLGHQTRYNHNSLTIFSNTIISVHVNINNNFVITANYSRIEVANIETLVYKIAYALNNVA